MIITAGLLAYRLKDSRKEVLLVHPGGPIFKNKDDGSWSIPKGIAEPGEDILSAAKREFTEETGFEPKEPLVSLGSIDRTDRKKVVYAWAFEGDFDVSKLVSNTCEIEWPPRSGKKMTIPEVDRGGYFDLKTAKVKVYPYQVPIIEAFEKL